jgi:hypothetical protein
MASEKITAVHVLFPVSILSFVVALFLGFQTTLLMSDRGALHQAHGQQDQLIEQVNKVKSQVNALAVGTLKLSEQGNKDAQTIIAQLKKAGVNVSDKPMPNGAPQGGAMSQMPPPDMAAPDAPPPPAP